MASRYSWVISGAAPWARDDVGTIGPRGSELDAGEIQESGEAFKMYDDDGEFHYGGFITGDFDGFEPLDDFGRANTGATEIRYKSGTWGKYEAI